MGYSKETIEEARREVRVTVVDQEQYDKGPFEFGDDFKAGTLQEVIDSLMAIQASIPDEYRAAASAEFGSVDGYEGSHYGNLVVVYRRPETDLEVVERLNKDAAFRQSFEDRERDEYNRLRAKFGHPTPR